MRQEFTKKECPWDQESCKRLVSMVLCGAKKGKALIAIEALVVVAEKVCCQERKGLGSQKEKASVEKKGKAWVAKKEKDLADMKEKDLADMKEKDLAAKKEKALTAMKERALAEMVLVARMKRLSQSKTRGPGV